MNTIEYLTTPGLATLYWPGVIAALLISIGAAVLSVFVVLRKLAFVGQGVSHAAFAGVGASHLIAIALLSTAAADGIWTRALVALTAIIVGVLIARLSRSGRFGADSAIGVILAVSMAIGFACFEFAARSAADQGLPQPPGLESTLFGSIIRVGWADTAITAGVMLLVLGAMWWFRRPMLMFAYDEQAAPAFGVRTDRMSLTLLLLLAISVAVAVQVAGVILATALFVMPGVAATAFARTWRGTILTAVVVSFTTVAGGIIFAFEVDLQVGPSIVAIQTLGCVVALLAGKIRAGKIRAGSAKRQNP